MSPTKSSKNNRSMFLGLLDENETKKDYKNNYHSLNNPSLKDNSDSGE